MLRPCLFLSALVACGLPSALADTIQLKDKAAITGKVLTEKPDQIVVDVGYTVLVIPRNQVVKILKSDAIAPAAKAPRGPRVGKPDRGGRGPGAHTGRTRLRFLPQRGRIPHHQFPRHRGREPDLSGGLSPEGRPARPQDLQAGSHHCAEQIWRPGVA